MNEYTDYTVIGLIESICKKLDIYYVSPNHRKAVEVKQDVQRLANIYIKLKEILAELYDIEDKYRFIKPFNELLEHTIEHLEKTDHEIKNEAYLLANKKLKNKLNEKNVKKE